MAQHVRLIILLCVLPFAASCVQPEIRGLQHELEATFASAHESGHFDGVALIALGDQTIHLEAFGMADREEGLPNAVDTRSRIASITKSFTAYLVLRLVEEGLMELDAPISRYLPSWEGPVDPSVHQLLSNTGGIAHYEGLRDVGLSINAFRPQAYTPEEFAALIEGMAPACDPGTCFHYSSFGYDLLGAAIETASGMNYAEALASYVTGPLGLTDTAYEVETDDLAQGYEPTEEGFTDAIHRDASNAYAAGGMISTANDLLRWSKALQGDGPLGQDVLSKMTTNQVGDIDPSVSYGYGVAVQDGTDTYGMGNIGLERPYLIHGGSWDGYRSLLVNVDHGAAAIVILSNVGAATDELALGRAVAAALNPILTDES